MARPLNFLHLTTFYPPYSFGGDAMYIYRLAHALGDEGHHVDVVHCVDSFRLLNNVGPSKRFAEHPNVTRHGLESGCGWLSPLLTHQTGYPFLKIDRIRSLIAGRPYDVIHYHNISLLGPSVLRLDTGAGQAVKLYTTHEHWLVCPMHVLWKYDQTVCEKPACLRCVLASNRPPQAWRYTGLLQRAASSVDLFLSPSRFTARMHAERGFPQPVHHLPYFLDEGTMSAGGSTPRPHPKPYFLFVGRLEVIKGLQTLIPLWQQVKGYDLLVAGEGTYGETLRSMAAGDPRIRFLGNQSQDELRPLYEHAVACLIPSITYETFGMSIIESFTRKTPVIVRNLGALPEVVVEGEGGMIYNNDSELLAAMQRLAESPALRRELGEKGHQAYRRLWCREAHLTRYQDYLSNTAVRKFGYVPWEARTAIDHAAQCLTAPNQAPIPYWGNS